jgi:beta-N-acetylhexosaminidase
MTRPVITDCAGERLSAAERELFARTQPFGFILFQRNCQTPEQVRALTADMRAVVGRADVPILIDQEGGRVARLKPPHWGVYRPAAEFGALAGVDMTAAKRAAHLNAALIADELKSLGVNVDCLPLLDLNFPGAHAIIGDRAYGGEPELVAALGRATCEGLMAGGVVPVIKHIPGHGRASVDSHLALPQVDARLAELEQSDFRPFGDLRDMPVAMTAHITYTAIDPENPATTSRKVIADVIRRDIGFEGVLLSDDISMKALRGSLEERARACLEAGCDIVLHCNGTLEERRRVLEATSPMTATEFTRLSRLMSAPPAAGFDRAAAMAELDRFFVHMNVSQHV